MLFSTTQSVIILMEIMLCIITFATVSCLYNLIKVLNCIAACKLKTSFVQTAFCLNTFSVLLSSNVKSNKLHSHLGFSCLCVLWVYNNHLREFYIKGIGYPEASFIFRCKNVFIFFFQFIFFDSLNFNEWRALCLSSIFYDNWYFTFYLIIVI